MAFVSLLKTCLCLLAVLLLAGSALALDAVPKSSAPAEPKKPPIAGEIKISKLTCASVCFKQQLGQRLEGNDLKLFQLCFAQAICSTELGPPVVYQPRPDQSQQPWDPRRSPYGAFPDGRV